MPSGRITRFASRCDLYFTLSPLLAATLVHVRRGCWTARLLSHGVRIITNLPWFYQNVAWPLQGFGSR